MDKNQTWTPYIFPRICPSLIIHCDFIFIFPAPNMATTFVPTAENGTTVRLDIARFDPFRWRGENKYFCIQVAYSEANISSLDVSCKYLPFSNDNRDLENIWPFYEDYWSYRFYKKIDISYSLEEFVLDSKICNDTLMLDFANQNTSQKFYIHGLTPYSKFNITLVACNEIDCQKETFIRLIETPPELPTCSPNYTLNATSPNSLYVNVSHLFQRCFNGEVLFMNISVARNRTGEIINKKSLVDSSEVLVDGLQPYELVCVFTNVVNEIGEGTSSHHICDRTHESGGILVVSFYFNVAKEICSIFFNPLTTNVPII